jgi:hypothetical protein
MSLLRREDRHHASFIIVVSRVGDFFAVVIGRPAPTVGGGSVGSFRGPDRQGRFH